MQAPGFKPPLGILYDADFGERLGSALSLCLLYGLDGKNECRMVSLSVSKPSLRAAAAAEIFGRFYAGAVSGAFGAIGRNLPTGLATSGGDPADTPIIKAVVDKPGFEHGLHSLNDTAEPVALLRNALTAQQDQNCVVLLMGPPVNLAPLLDLPGAKGWIERKARVLVIADGPFTAPAHRAAARKLLAEWPGPIVFAGADVAAAAPYPAASFEKDFAWSSAHPLVEAYKAAGVTGDLASPEMAAAMHAVREKDRWFGLSEAGTLSIGDDGTVRLTPAAGGRHRRLTFDAAKREKLQAAYVELISAKPVPRMPRFRPQQAQQEQKKDVPPVKK